MKICSKCKVKKPLTDFYRSGRKVFCYCKNCCREYNKIYWRKNRDKLLEKARKYQEKNREIIQKRSAIRWKRMSPEARQRKREKARERWARTHIVSRRSPRKPWKISPKRIIDDTKNKIGKCQKCGYSKCIQALEFHHQEEKSKHKDKLWRFGFKAMADKMGVRWTRDELKKCILVCANCHREIHFLKP